MSTEYERKRYTVLGWATCGLAALLAIDSLVMHLTHYEQGATHVFLRGFGVQMEFTRAQDLLGAAVVLGALGTAALVMGSRKPSLSEPGKPSRPGERA